MYGGGQRVCKQKEKKYNWGRKKRLNLQGHTSALYLTIPALLPHYQYFRFSSIYLVYSFPPNEQGLLLKSIFYVIGLIQQVITWDCLCGRTVWGWVNNLRVFDQDLDHVPGLKVKCITGRRTYSVCFVLSPITLSVFGCLRWNKTVIQYVCYYVMDVC